MSTEAPSRERKTTEPERKKLVLFGGNGFVGQGIVRAALKKGVDIVSISRSGGPTDFQLPAFAPGKVEWKKGDILEPNSYKEELKGATGVVSCVGGFGSNEVSKVCSVP